MFRLLIWLFLAYIGFRIIKSLTAPKPSPPSSHHHDGVETVQDPVCKKYLAKEDAVIGTLDGTRHYFCSMDCLEKFREQLDHTHSS
jgi:YHS domain-containing protein